jgi:hypothetical protein
VTIKNKGGEEQTTPVFNLSSKVTHTAEPESDVVELSFEGYNGGPVDLRDYGLSHPMYYRVQGITYGNKVPILFEHWTPIGHTTDVTKTEQSLGGKGKTSYPSDKRTEVVEALRNGFPFQASMGLRVPSKEEITFLSKGEKRNINGRTVVGPAHIAENSSLVEMTVTLSGRDNTTTFQLLNQEAIEMIKNSLPTSTPPENVGTEAAPVIPHTTPVAPPATPVVANSTPVTPVAPMLQNSTGTQLAVAPVTPTQDGLFQFKLSKLLAKYTGDKYEKMIEDGLKNGDDLGTIENSIKLDLYENGMPKMPSMNESRGTEQGNEILAHFALACGLKAETLVKNGIDKKVVDKADSAARWTFVETLVNIANSAEPSRRFTGFSDLDVVCNSLYRQNRAMMVQNTAFSTFDMPNLFKKVTDMMLEDRWALNEPFAVKFLKEESNKDFRTVQRIRPGGGTIWEDLKPDGKIPMTHFGKETEYRSNLSTIAQLVIFNREHVYNDDMDVISSLLDAMVEGALVVPDIQLGNLMLVKAAAANTFWVNADNSRTSFALSRANLTTAYQDLRQYSEDRGKNLVTLINDRWTLITSIEKEETAWDILKQDYIVNDTTANTKTGSKNWWFNRLDMAVFPQMGNTSLFGSGTFVSTNTWVLWPSSKKFSPYTITYLRGQRRPTIETVDLPENMLGFGVRGYWDVKINERERLAIGRYNG